MLSRVHPCPCPGIAWHGMAWHGMVDHGGMVAWYDMTRGTRRTLPIPRPALLLRQRVLVWQSARGWNTDHMAGLGAMGLAMPMPVCPAPSLPCLSCACRSTSPSGRTDPCSCHLAPRYPTLPCPLPISYPNPTWLASPRPCPTLPTPPTLLYPSCISPRLVFGA